MAEAEKVAEAAEAAGCAAVAASGAQLIFLGTGAAIPSNPNPKPNPNPNPNATQVGHPSHALGAPLPLGAWPRSPDASLRDSYEVKCST